jgi:FAD/FMN-containing dehydrogenase
LVTQVRPRSAAEVAELVSAAKGKVCFGVGTGLTGPRTAFRGWKCDCGIRALRNTALTELETNLEAVELDLGNFDRVLDYSPSDQVVQVGVGIELSGIENSDSECETPTLQSQLAAQNQCIPIGGRRIGSVGELIALNLPHTLQSQCGSWRDWILGATIVLADGSIAKAGSKAVKNVAGYDLHKFLVGTRDSIAILVDVTLRTFPLDALPTPKTTTGPSWTDRNQYAAVFEWTQRTLSSDFNRAKAGVGSKLLMADEGSSTFWCALDDPSEQLPRYPGDWVVTNGCGNRDCGDLSPTQIRLMKRAKAIFDPTNKLNPGEWGFM